MTKYAKLQNLTGLPLNQFIIRQIYKSDLTRLDTIRLCFAENCKQYSGRCSYATKKRGAILCAHVSNLLTFPYINDEDIFIDPCELFVFILGHEMFHFLCSTKQITNRNTEANADAYGSIWLEEWRNRNLLYDYIKVHTKKKIVRSDWRTFIVKKQQALNP